MVKVNPSLPPRGASVSVPLKLNETIHVGIIYRAGIPLSAAGVAFVDAIRTCVAGK